jgi:hypothetical protein
MFWKKLKYYFFTPIRFSISKEDKLIDPGLIAICIIFLQYLIAVEKPNINQLFSLFSFSVAIPMLAMHFLGTQLLDKPSPPIPAFAVRSYEFLYSTGFMFTGLGILFTLGNVSWVFPVAFMLSIFAGTFILGFIKSYSIKIEREEAKKKSQ